MHACMYACMYVYMFILSLSLSFCNAAPTGEAHTAGRDHFRDGRRHGLWLENGPREHFQADDVIYCYYYIIIIIPLLLLLFCLLLHTYIVHIYRSLDAWFVTGGTNAGVMKCMGEFKAKYNPKARDTRSQKYPLHWLDIINVLGLWRFRISGRRPS